MAVRQIVPALPSNRKFGGVFSAVFAAAGIYGYFQASNAWPALVIFALLFAAISITASTLLAPLNRLWFRFGLLLGRIVSPIVLGLVFFVLITPIALLARLVGRDALRLTKRTAQSYWLLREPPGPDPESFKNQF